MLCIPVFDMIGLLHRRGCFRVFLSIVRARTHPSRYYRTVLDINGRFQVAAGRTFKDRPSFVAKPERVVFKDFVVGKVRLPA